MISTYRKPSLCSRSLKGSRLVLTIPIALGLFAGSSAFAAGKSSKDLQSLPNGSTVDVIVQFAQSPDNADLVRIASTGAHAKKLFKHFTGGVFTLPAAAIAAISADRIVTYISPDRKLAG